MVHKKIKKKRQNGLLYYLVVILLVIAVGFFIYNIGQFYGITGNATGTANLTISQITSINFTTGTINWSTGEVDSGQSVAVLDTSAGTVTDGNWTAVSAGLVIENIGNQNVSLQLATGKSAAGFIGGSDGGGLTDGEYRFNVSSVEAGSCTNATDYTGTGNGMTSGYNRSLFFNANFTSPGTLVCDNFFFDDAKDTIRIDLYLNISADSNITGNTGDIITATATAVS